MTPFLYFVAGAITTVIAIVVVLLTVAVVRVSKDYDGDYGDWLK